LSIGLSIDVGTQTEPELAMAVQTESTFEISESSAPSPPAGAQRIGRVKRGRSGVKRRVSAPACPTPLYDADWAAVHVHPLSFHQKVRQFLRGSELPDYDFGLDLWGKDLACMECFEVGQFECTRCHAVVCGGTQEHFTVHERAALQDNCAISELFRAVHMACVGFV